MIKGSLYRIMLLVVAFSSIFMFGKLEAHCENITVVIDPGHGGEALGGNMDDRAEREINLITAMAMKERLEQYEGVEVYLTRTNCTDKDKGRKERLEIAKDHNADFFFSIHYNMSEEHNLYGSEVWIGSQGSFYEKGYQFATIELEALSQLGLVNRGIKCRLDNGTDEYYGILKYGEEFNIPSVIIEHCHLDNENDSPYWNEEVYKQFGITDADCAAKFLGLSSFILGVDYSDYELVNVAVPDKSVDRDMTGPDICNIELLSNNESIATIRINSYDNDTYIQYYTYSYDGGKTFEPLIVWDDKENDILDINISLINNESQLIIRTYNKYDYYADSNVIELPAYSADDGILGIDDNNDNAEYRDADIILVKEGKKKSATAMSPVFVFFLVFTTLFLIMNIIFVIIYSASRKKKRKKKNKKSVRKEDFEFDFFD